MNLENFASFIRNPSRLYQLSYQELKSLVIEHPYSANLRLLLLLKSRLENDPRYSDHLHQAAAHTFDRAHLLDYLRQTAATLSPELEDVLELKELSQWEDRFDRLPVVPTTEETVEALAAPPPLPAEEPITDDFSLPLVETEPVASETLETEAGEPPAEAPTPDDFSLPLLETEPVASEAMETEAGEPPADFTWELPIISSLPSDPKEAIEPAYELPYQTVADAAALTAVLEELTWPVERPSEATPVPDPSAAEPLSTEPTHYTPPTGGAAPLPKQAFDSWQQPSVATQARLRRLVARQKERDLANLHPGPTNGKHPLETLAVDSISDHHYVASETLARLLVQQGRFDKARAMYKELCLLFPEKSAYFAAIIENLQQKH